MRKLALATALAILAACGGSSSSSPTVWSCNIPAAGICIELGGPAPASDQTALQTQCTTIRSIDPNAAFSTSACPTANRLAGQCNIPAPSGTTGETVTGYMYPPQDATTVQTTCTTAQPNGLGGTWVP